MADTNITPPRSTYLSNFEFYNLNLIINPFGIHYLGPPANYCNGKPDGQFANPDNRNQFFSCINEVASGCLECGPNLVFKAQCRQCLFDDQGKTLFFYYLLLN